MESFEGKLAVVTGGGTGMGRELVLQLAAQGCSVATCDINTATVEATVAGAQGESPDGVNVTAHRCDVSNEADVGRFRDEVLEQHSTDHVNLLFNNAGIGGGGSFLKADRAEWDRTFAIDWGGVYFCARAFVPLLVASDEAHLVNTSSVNGFWAILGHGVPHTAYSTAKFAVKGFSEALLEDFRLNAPHVGVSVVMPGHIGTDIVNNSRTEFGAAELDGEELAEARTMLIGRGLSADDLDDDTVRSIINSMGDLFRDNAPMTAAEAATVILNGVRARQWRILVGEDAHKLDELVRSDPWGAYEPGTFELGIVPGG